MYEQGIPSTLFSIHMAVILYHCVLPTCIVHVKKSADILALKWIPVKWSTDCKATLPHEGRFCALLSCILCWILIVEGGAFFFSPHSISGRAKTRFSPWKQNSYSLRHNSLLEKIIKILKHFFQFISLYLGRVHRLLMYFKWNCVSQKTDALI